MDLSGFKRSDNVEFDQTMAGSAAPSSLINPDLQAYLATSPLQQATPQQPVFTSMMQRLIGLQQPMPQALGLDDVDKAQRQDREGGEAISDLAMKERGYQAADRGEPIFDQEEYDKLKPRIPFDRGSTIDELAATKNPARSFDVERRSPLAPPDIRDAITRAATEAGVDPAFALAVGERESSFRPTAANSKSIYGIFQMSGPLRERHGIGDSDDPYTQAKGWTGHVAELNGEMGPVLGRKPTDPEIYLGHHFGGRRAARMIARMDPETPVTEVFTPKELKLNPHIGKAGTVGALIADITADIERRKGKYGGGAMAQAPDFSAFGEVP